MEATGAAANADAATRKRMKRLKLCTFNSFIILSGRLGQVNGTSALNLGFWYYSAWREAVQKSTTHLVGHDPYRVQPEGAVDPVVELGRSQADHPDGQQWRRRGNRKMLSYKGPVAGAAKRLGAQIEARGELRIENLQKGAFVRGGAAAPNPRAQLVGSRRYYRQLCEVGIVHIALGEESDA